MKNSINFDENHENQNQSKFFCETDKGLKRAEFSFSRSHLSFLFNLKRVKIEKWFSNLNPSHEVSIPRYFTTTDSVHTATYD